ncbi:16S rRNA (guanine(527)-N(7))-methyltransferase RsmG [Vallitalea pronyensis]|uniref:Ribosomal RNA small subunit methyltransferase G n=1 Tax=Vallitalea pronyensis TaxID=1348613 RepID=A0A8J8MQF6_9FIRM|nr:16S rRNA (guanine(527)-N(7))-methyltransferase RsmG [Vallitalea pronyensis]QUI25563.1 16S rRNA (guanine(527)-N(7))-methyltransferase RsmG [Vallitalea pronyensis]
MTVKHIKMLAEGASKLGYHLTQHQISQFEAYYEMLIHWNEKMNLTAITEEKEVIIKHFLDSIAIHQVMPLTHYHQVIDLGTGAGFPGIPLKIVYPHIKLTLADSLNKRIQFLTAVVNALALRDVQCMHGRAEDLGSSPLYREQYDVCVSRAVADLSILSEYCMPFVRMGGYFIPYKAKDSHEELEGSKRAIETLGGYQESVKSVQIPQSDIERIFVMIKKEGITPKKYPRKAGKPKKNPL